MPFIFLEGVGTHSECLPSLGVIFQSLIPVLEGVPMKITRLTEAEYIGLQMVYDDEYISPHIVLVEDRYNPFHSMWTARCLCGWHSREFTYDERNKPDLMARVRNHSTNHNHAIWTSDGYYDIGTVGKSYE